MYDEIRDQRMFTRSTFSTRPTCSAGPKDIARMDLMFHDFIHILEFEEIFLQRYPELVGMHFTHLGQIFTHNNEVQCEMN